MGRWDDPWWPAPSRPRPAKGGIRSRSRRGAFAESWWGRRWIQILEGFPIGGRLQRGRSYARQGQVLQIRFEPGELTARVQGSRAQPYAVSLTLEPLSGDERRAVAQELAGRPRLAASLLAGEMPRELEEAFSNAGIPLFPTHQGDLRTECSCPDWSNPCKHIAAVYYLVAEELDRDPFLLLRLRGLARTDLVQARDEEDAPGEVGPPSAAAGTRPTPLPTDPAEFWSGEASEAGVSGTPDTAGAEVSESGAREPGSTAAGPDNHPAVHLRTLGAIPFWRGEEDPVRVLEDRIRRARVLGTEILAGPE